MAKILFKFGQQHLLWWSMRVVCRFNQSWSETGKYFEWIGNNNFKSPHSIYQYSKQRVISARGRYARERSCSEDNYTTSKRIRWEKMLTTMRNGHIIGVHFTILKARLRNRTETTKQKEAKVTWNDTDLPWNNEIRISWLLAVKKKRKKES